MTNQQISYQEQKAENGRRNKRTIWKFSKEKGLLYHRQEYAGVPILYVEAEGLTLDQEVLEWYGKMWSYLKANNLFTHFCFKIADQAWTDGLSGRLASFNCDDKRLIVFGNHCINYDLFENGSVAAVDFTAGYNIDHDNGDFQVLVIQAQSMEELLCYLSELYGGQWHTEDPVYSFEYYPQHYEN